MESNFLFFAQFMAEELPYSMLISHMRPGYGKSRARIHQLIEQQVCAPLAWQSNTPWHI